MKKKLLSKSLLVLTACTATICFQNAFGMGWIQKQQQAAQNKLSDAQDFAQKKAIDMIPDKVLDSQRAYRQKEDARKAAASNQKEAIGTKEYQSFSEKMRSALSPVAEKVQEKVQQVKDLRQAQKEVKEAKTTVKKANLEKEVQEIFNTDYKNMGMGLEDPNNRRKLIKTDDLALRQKQDAAELARYALDEKKQTATDARKVLFGLDEKKKSEEPSSIFSTSMKGLRDADAARMEAEKTNNARTATAQDAQARARFEAMKEPSSVFSTSTKNLRDAEIKGAQTAEQKASSAAKTAKSNLSKATETAKEKELELTAAKQRFDNTNLEIKKTEDSIIASNKVLAGLENDLKSAETDSKRAAIQAKIDIENNKINDSKAYLKDRTFYAGIQKKILSSSSKESSRAQVNFENNQIEFSRRKMQADVLQADKDWANMSYAERGKNTKALNDLLSRRMKEGTLSDKTRRAVGQAAGNPLQRKAILQHMDNSDAILATRAKRMAEETAAATKERTQTYLADKYATMGLKENATDTEIKKAYFTLAKELHPDRRGPGVSEEAANEKFKAMKDAYDELISFRGMSPSQQKQSLDQMDRQKKAAEEAAKYYSEQN